MTKDKKILLAEDDPFLIKIIGNRLKEEGFNVDMATNGGEALDLAGKNEYDLIMLDLIMPIKDGFEVLSGLKKMKVKTPVLVFTNLSQEEDKEEVLKLGAKGYYVKSDIAIDELVKVVRSFI